MKVAVMTIFRSLNYGAVLQAYALHKKINNMGYDCSIIDYRPEDLEKTFHTVFRSGRNIKMFIVSLLWILKYSESKKMLNKANEFFREKMKLTRRYYDYDELVSDKNQADVYFCGSDQIWNPMILGTHPRVFLEFVHSKDIVKASYAASIGINKIDEKYKEIYKQYLQTFDFVSVREESAKSILSELTDKEVRVIPDPVFLLDKQDWLDIATFPVVGERYILCYLIYQPKYIDSFIRRIKAETGYKVLTVTTKPYQKGLHDRTIRDVGPDGFLGLVANAELIITSSFHGTAFAILLEKQFYTLASPERGSRVTEIVGKLGLSDRIIDKDGDLDRKQIDYGSVRIEVEKLRYEAIKYLQLVLKYKKKSGATR